MSLAFSTIRDRERRSLNGLARFHAARDRLGRSTPVSDRVWIHSKAPFASRVLRPGGPRADGLSGVPTGASGSWASCAPDLASGLSLALCLSDGRRYNRAAST